MLFAVFVDFKSRWIISSCVLDCESILITTLFVGILHDVSF